MGSHKHTKILRLTDPSTSEQGGRWRTTDLGWKMMCGLRWNLKQLFLTVQPSGCFSLFHHRCRIKSTSSHLEPSRGTHSMVLCTKMSHSSRAALRALQHRVPACHARVRSYQPLPPTSCLDLSKCTEFFDASCPYRDDLAFLESSLPLSSRVNSSAAFYGSAEASLAHQWGPLSCLSALRGPVISSDCKT